ncbi:MAG: hypothetical protein Q8P34_16960 [Bacteroidota bacterium]|nr:hypothetical protein [Bacteroidota bacterium]
MCKFCFLFLFVGIGFSCATVSQKKEESSAEVKAVAFEGFIPEENQEILEMVRGDILISKLLRDSTLIAEEVLVNPDRNLLGGVSPGSPHYEEYMAEVKEVRPRLVNYIEEYGPMVMELVKSRTYEESEIREQNFFRELILKYAERTKLEFPMLSQLELISQGADYYAYRYKVINYKEFDLISFSSYLPWYRVKFVFENGVLIEYEHF